MVIATQTLGLESLLEAETQFMSPATKGKMND